LELTTGKAFNPYYVKRDFKKKDLFQDYINLKYGFSQWQNNKQATPKKPSWAKEAKVADIRKAIDNALLPLVEQNIISNRAELIYQLQEWGYELNRTGKDTITIIDQNNKKTKLKGAIYSKGFDNGFAGIREEIERSKRETVTGARRTLQSVRAELNRNIREQAKYNAERYRPTKKNTKQNDKVAKVSEKMERATTLASAPKFTPKGLEDDRDREEAITSIRSRTERKRERNRAAAERINSNTDRAKELDRKSEIFNNAPHEAIRTISKRTRQRELRRGLKESINTLVSALGSFIEAISKTIKQPKEEEKQIIKSVLETETKEQQPRGFGFER
jgi:hypothetical protein